MNTLNAATSLPEAPRLEFKGRLHWRVLSFLVVLHIGAVAALFFWSWPAVLTAVFLWFATGMWGITVGYHRLLTHKAFETSRPVLWFHAFWASLAMQLGPLSWVKIHRAHHAHSDDIGDPHNQNVGFFFGHMGWTFMPYKIVGRSKELRSAHAKDLRESTSILKRDPVLLFFEKAHYWIFLASLVFFYAVGGWPMLLWAGCFRTVFVLHATWTVNSLAHRYGYRRFVTRDRSKNNWFVSILTWGEGWHNNHHRFPSSAKQGLFKAEFDVSWMWIRMLEKCGLAWNLKLPSKEQLSPVRLNSIEPISKTLTVVAQTTTLSNPSAR